MVKRSAGSDPEALAGLPSDEGSEDREQMLDRASVESVLKALSLRPPAGRASSTPPPDEEAGAVEEQAPPEIPTRLSLSDIEKLAFKAPASQPGVPAAAASGAETGPEKGGTAVDLDAASLGQTMKALFDSRVTTEMESKTEALELSSGKSEEMAISVADLELESAPLAAELPAPEIASTPDGPAVSPPVERPGADTGAIAGATASATASVTASASANARVGAATSSTEDAPERKGGLWMVGLGLLGVAATVFFAIESGWVPGLSGMDRTNPADMRPEGAGSARQAESYSGNAKGARSAAVRVGAGSVPESIQQAQEASESPTDGDESARSLASKKRRAWRAAARESARPSVEGDREAETRVSVSWQGAEPVAERGEEDRDRAQSAAAVDTGPGGTPSPAVAAEDELDGQKPPLDAVSGPSPAGTEGQSSSTGSRTASSGQATGAMEGTRSEGLSEVPGREAVKEALEKVRAGVAACAGGKRGVAEVVITVRNSGRVMQAVVGGDFAGSKEGSCIARAVRKARFTPFIRPSFTLIFPFAL